MYPGAPVLFRVAYKVFRIRTWQVIKGFYYLLLHGLPFSTFYTPGYQVIKSPALCMFEIITLD